MKLITPFPSLVINNKGRKTLVITDLHLGWETQLSPKGIYIPSQTKRMLKKIHEIIRISKPDSIIVLGDVKDEVKKIKIDEWREVPLFFEDVLKYVKKIEIIPGNHDGNLDPLIPSNISILPPTGVRIGDTGLIHGHAWLSPQLFDCENLIMGHMHPRVYLNNTIGFKSKEQVWVKMVCDPIKLANAFLKHMNVKVELEKTSKIFLRKYGVLPSISKVLIMPSFNDLIGGFDIKALYKNGKREYIGPILRSKAPDLTTAEIFLLDGSFIGTVKDFEYHLG